MLPKGFPVLQKGPHKGVMSRAMGPYVKYDLHRMELGIQRLRFGCRL
jgi:hypothetical protein